MLRKIALIVSICLMTAFAYSQETTKTPELFDFANGQYMMVKENGLVIFPNKPMLKERLGKYGDIVLNPKTKERHFNVSDKGKVTPEGLEIHDLLTRMQGEDGFFILQVVILEYDKVSIVKYTRTKWNDHIDKILKAFE